MSHIFASFLVIPVALQEAQFKQLATDHECSYMMYVQMYVNVRTFVYNVIVSGL